MKFKFKYIFQLTILFLSLSCWLASRNIHSKKNQWLKNLLSRTKRSVYSEYAIPGSKIQENFAHTDTFLKTRPCPNACNCNYDTINCNDLIDTCVECELWQQIDFNQIENMKPKSFEKFKFAPNRTTHIIFYKLLNSTLGPKTFHSMKVAENSQIEITFQYNSLIKFTTRKCR